MLIILLAAIYRSIDHPLHMAWVHTIHYRRPESVEDNPAQSAWNPDNLLQDAADVCAAEAISSVQVVCQQCGLGMDCGTVGTRWDNLEASR